MIFLQLLLYIYSLSVRFSLVLVDDRAPVLRRPLSPFSSSLLALRDRAQRSIEQAVASTVGPNRFVVSIADTPNSWLAFQVRMRGRVLVVVLYYYFVAVWLLLLGWGGVQ